MVAMHSYATRLQIWINIMIIILVAKEEDYATHLQMLMQLLQMQVRAVTLDACLYAFHRIIHCSSLTICTSYDTVCIHFEELLGATVYSITTCMLLRVCIGISSAFHAPVQHLGSSSTCQNAMDDGLGSHHHCHSFKMNTMVSIFIINIIIFLQQKDYQTGNQLEKDPSGWINRCHVLSQNHLNLSNISNKSAQLLVVEGDANYFGACRSRIQNL